MPSDSRLDLAQSAVAGALARFDAFIDGALSQGEALLSSGTDQTERTLAELGPFAIGRIDPRRFAAVCTRTQPLDERHLEAASAAMETLRRARERSGAVVVTVPNGGSFLLAVEAALAEEGKAFAAARTLASLHSGGTPSDDVMPNELSFAAWTRSERRVAPPLIVRVAGGDLRAGGLEGYLDGRQQIVLLVDGACAPAPLARLITPGTLVIETNDAFGLDQMARTTGPAVAALVPDSAARFVHDPALGAETWQRLRVAFLPEPPHPAVSGFSRWQLQEEAAQLRALAAAPHAGADGAPVEATRDVVDRLTAWLLTDLDAPSGERAS